MNPITGTTYVLVDPIPNKDCDICLEKLTEDIVAHPNGKEKTPEHPLHRTCAQRWVDTQALYNKQITCVRCFQSVDQIGYQNSTRSNGKTIFACAFAGAFVGTLLAAAADMGVGGGGYNTALRLSALVSILPWTAILSTAAIRPLWHQFQVQMV
jgi:hypothetical protein